MKRIGYLIDTITDIDNLYWAYWKAKRGKSQKPEVVAFGASLDANLQNLREEVVSGKVNVGEYHYFTIYDPKERQICAASFKERVLHHALMNVCHPFFEKQQIYDSYACRLEKGTYKALDRAKRFSAQYAYFAKLDVRKYFETLDHSILKNLLSQIFKDKQLLLILFQIIDSYENAPNKGIPIGNLTSQYFANHFLSKADHFVKETLKIKPYVRYMDDMILWGEDIALLKQKVKALQNYLETVLKCELKPVVMNKIEKGLPFLGYVIWKEKITLAKRSKTRFRQKLKRLDALLDAEKITQTEYQRKILPLLAFIQKASSFLFRKIVILPLEDSQKARTV
ncbi:MAG: RNA-directed DNA polymerase [Bacteroidia bacterium]|nr:RNA-directed DNA polymerase [Bacteroidia bacterium]